jgi:hypothetical protein
MSFLPEPIRASDVVSFSDWRAYKELTNHERRAIVNRTKDQIDAMTVGDASGFCVDEEIDLLHRKMARAGDDPIAQALVLRKLEGYVESNERRMKRRFG